MKFEIEISDDAYDLLGNIHKNGCAEYKDTDIPSINSFMSSDEYTNGNKTVDWYKKRNFGGTYYLTEELLKYNLIYTYLDTWHTTFKVTEFGKEVLQIVDRDKKIDSLLK